MVLGVYSFRRVIVVVLFYILINNIYSLLYCWRLSHCYPSPITRRVIGDYVMTERLGVGVGIGVYGHSKTRASHARRWLLWCLGDKMSSRCDELNLLAPWWSPLPVACTGVMDNQES
jgi:hypothetical protein